MKLWSAAVLSIVAAAGLALSADTLVLRDGRRFEGTLVGVRGDTIEFEHRGGRDDGRVRRYDRSDVRSIQFDDYNLHNDTYSNDAGSRSGMRERQVDVQANTEWTDTGIDVRSGQTMIFASSGTVRWGPNRKDGPAGERNSPHNNARPMPDRNAAALIGRIGSGGDPFFIGDSREPIRMRGGGRLFLGVNDDYVSDNSGWFKVVISY